MEKCLLCDQLFLEKETFLGIISIQKNQEIFVLIVSLLLKK